MALVTQVSWADRQSGDVGCLHGKGLISETIMAGEKLAHEVVDGRVWSHCFICVGTIDTTGKTINGKILEAIYPHISLSPWNVYDNDETVIFHFNVDQDLKQAALLKIILNYVDDGYDLKGVAFGMSGIEILRALHLPADNNDYANDHKQWCSELNTRYNLEVLPDKEVPSLIDPQLYYNHMMSLL